MQDWRWPALAAMMLSMAACGDGERPRGEPYVPSPEAEQATKAYVPADVAELPVAQRAALVQAHVAAAIALYRGGESDAAALHLTKLDARSHPDLMGALEAAGYDPAPIDQLYAEIEAGTPAEEAEETIAEAQEMLAAFRGSAQGDVGETTEYLMKSLAREYEAGVVEGEVTDPVAFQMAYGLAVAARDIVAAQVPETHGSLTTELDVLVHMWPSKGPLPGTSPAPEMMMAEQLSRVKLALASLP